MLNDVASQRLVVARRAHAVALAKAHFREYALRNLSLNCAWGRYKLARDLASRCEAEAECVYLCRGTPGALEAFDELITAEAMLRAAQAAMQLALNALGRKLAERDIIEIAGVTIEGPGAP